MFKRLFLSCCRWLSCSMGIVCVAVGLTALDCMAAAAHCEEATLYAESGETVNVSTNVITRTLQKIGGGTLVLPLTRLPQGVDVDIAVRDGALGVSAFDPSDVDSPIPNEVLAKAALWLDATMDGKVAYTASNGVDWVDAWYDVRETGNSDVGYSHLRALPNLGPTNMPPQLVVKDGIKSVWFGGYPSGISMDWCGADGSVREITDIRHVFIMYGVYESHGFVLGTRSVSRFHIMDTTRGLPTSSICEPFCTDAGAAYCGRVFVNGRLVEPCITGQLKQNQFQLLEYDCCGILGYASNFFNDRNYFRNNPSYPQNGGNRIGGDYIAEALIFTNELTEIERMSVGTYLMNKHLGGVSPVPSIAVAEGAQVGVDAKILDRASVMSGDGEVKFVCDGGAVTIPPMVGYGFSMPTDISGGIFGLSNRHMLKLHDGDSLTIEQTGYGNPVASISGDAGQGRISKEGNGSATVSALPETVTSVVVRAGTLHLAAVEKKSGVPIGGSATAAVFENPDFEVDGIDTNSEYRTEQNVGGWNLVGVKNDLNCIIFISGDGTGAAWGSSGGIYGSPLPTPDGGTAMMFKGDVSAWTSVSVPCDGIYELSFNAASRVPSGSLPLDVCIGKDEDSLVKVGSFMPTQKSYMKFTFTVPYLDAGEYQFWFRSRQLGEDKAAAVDNIRMKLLSGLPLRSNVIPNGSFEDIEGAYNSGFKVNELSTDNVAAGWTLTQTNGWVTGTAPSAAFTTPSVSWEHFDSSHNRSGIVQLMLDGYGARAETTFTPSMGGRYRLRAAVANRRYSSNDNKGKYLRASLVAGSVTNDFGTINVLPYHLTETEWPDAVTVVAGEEVTLMLESRDTTDRTHTLVDDLVLVPSMDDDELVSDGGFEQPGTWKVDELYQKPDRMNGASRYNYAYFPNAYGHSRCEGECWMAVVQNDIVSQRIEFPSAGLYRLRFFAHSRVDNPAGHGLNPVKAFYVAEGSTETNWIAAAKPFTTNFVEQVHTFLVPAACKATFGFQGCYAANEGEAEYVGVDHTTAIDAVSIRRVIGVGDGLPDVSERLSVKVDAGAKLSLDFDGTLYLNALYLGGHAVRGEVSAETHPEFVEGPGRMYAKMHGLTITIR